MFVIKSNNRRKNFFKSLMVAVLLTGFVLLDANLPASTTPNSQYEIVEAGLFGWHRDVYADHAHVDGELDS